MKKNFIFQILIFLFAFQGFSNPQITGFKIGVGSSNYVTITEDGNISAIGGFGEISYSDKAPFRIIRIGSTSIYYGNTQYASNYGKIKQFGNMKITHSSNPFLEIEYSLLLYSLEGFAMTCSLDGDSVDIVFTGF